ncbi:MAG: Holliday junction branch migration DNA helicase RuvB [Candidatus Parcubacteria bacterium]|nr:Holliday junction branch migration DNA helicase RuvB [Candidatus Parcubacteria bacterium]
MPQDDKNRIISAKESADEVDFEKSLRPKKLADYIGQNKVKDNLMIFMAAAKKRNEPIEHVLLHGCPGLGKTTLAHIIANEMGSNIKITSGPAIEKTGDLAAILTNLANGDILFIDEIHRLNKIIEEVLYPAMEDFALDIVIGKGPSARTLRLDLPKFTLIGATTRVSLISAPLRDRFGVNFRLDFYNDEDIEKIIKRNAKILDIEIDDQASGQIAKRARKTPRVANRLLKRVRDFAQVKGNGKINLELANDALTKLDIDQLGLDEIDRKILQLIIEKFSGGPVGLSTLAAAIGEEMETIEDIYEPFLMQLGFLSRTPRGRTVTKLGYEHLGIKPAIDPQNSLI